MTKKTIFSKLRSRYARFTSPMYSWCACISVNEPEEDQRPYHTRAGRQVSSNHGQPQWEMMQAASTACSVATAGPELRGDTSIEMNEIVASSSTKGEQFESVKLVSSAETVEILPECSCDVKCTSASATAAEPPTPLELSPSGSRKLSQTSEDSQDGQAERTASVESSGERAADPIQAPASITIDSANSSGLTTTTINTTTTLRQLAAHLLGLLLQSVNTTPQRSETSNSLRQYSAAASTAGVSLMRFLLYTCSRPLSRYYWSTCSWVPTFKGQQRQQQQQQQHGT